MNDYSVRLASNGQEAPAFDVEHDEETINVARILEGQFSMRTPSGAWAAAMTYGTEIELRRGAETVFEGFVVNKGRQTDGEDGGVLADVGLEEKWQRRLLRHTCSGYIDGQDAPGNTLRDSAYLAPFKWDEPLRDPNSTLDENGEPPVALGVRIEEAVRAVFGLGHPWLIRCDESGWFRAADLQGDAGNAVIAEDAEDLVGLTRPWDDTGYRGTAVTVETRPLRVASPKLRDTGTISTVQIILVGRHDATDPGDSNPTVRVCRDADAATRTYTDVPLTRTDNYLGTTFSAWTGTVDLTTDGASQKNALDVEVTLNGTDAHTDSTRIYAMKPYASTESILGFTEEDVDDYVDPCGIQEREWFIDTLQDQTLLQAAQRVQESTESPDAVNPSPYWDLWWTPTGGVYFKARRGEDLAIEYTDGDSRLKSLRAEEDATMVAYQMYGIGAGEGRNRIQLADDTDYASGGLRISENDPDDGALYGEAARVLVYRDQSVKSLSELRRRTRAAMSLHREPLVRSSFELEDSPARAIRVGDTVSIRSLKNDVAARVRIAHIRRSQRGDENPQIDVELGEPRKNNVQRLHDGQVQDMRQQGTASPRSNQNAVSGIGVPFTKDDYARIPILVPDGYRLQDYDLILQALPYQGTTKDATPDFGLFTFQDGGANVYTDGIEWGVDVSVDANGTPNDWANDRHSVVWGDEDTPETLRIKILNLLDTDANGRIRPGIHYVYLKAKGATAKNPLGLGNVSATGVPRYAGGETT